MLSKMLRALLVVVVLTAAFSSVKPARAETPAESETDSGVYARQQTYYLYLYYRGSYKTTVYGSYSYLLQLFNYYKKLGYTPYGPYLYN
jgi:hypothetical protein